VLECAEPSILRNRNFQDFLVRGILRFQNKNSRRCDLINALWYDSQQVALPFACMCQRERRTLSTQTYRP